MRSIRAGWALLAGLLVLGGVQAREAQAQEIEAGDLRIRKLPGFPGGTTHGYREYSFEIVNESGAAAHEVRIELVGADFGNADALRLLSGSVLAGPSSRVRLDLLQPPLWFSADRARLTVDGRRLVETIPIVADHPMNPTFVATTPGRATSTTGPALRVLVSQRLGDFPSHPDPQRYLAATTPVEAWSGDWLAYSGFDGVALDFEEWAAARAAVRSALVAYVEAGGSLFVAAAPQVSSLGLREGLETATEGGPLTVTCSGFGEILTAAVGPEELGADAVVRLSDSWQATFEPWKSLRDLGTFHRLFTVRPETGVPLRGIFLVVAVFMILVGPVNLFVLAKLGRRIRLLWTVPAISILASGIVFAYALANEGFVSLERAESLTVLDERTQRAATLGWKGFYATLTPAGGFVFDRRSEVSGVVPGSYSASSSGTRTLEWRGGQSLESGWIRARLPSYFIVRKSEPRRERLPLRRRQGGRLGVTNGLGADLEALWVADARGRIHSLAGGLEAGASGELAATSETAQGRVETLRGQFYRANLPGQLAKLSRQPSLYLLPGTYLARLVENPFLERGLESVRERRVQAFVYGFSAEIPEADP